METKTNKIRFIHLSDIHFNSRAASYGFDPDQELRSAVVRDIARMCDSLGPANAILVTGDIAYAGKKREFEDAARWLDSVCNAAGCGTEAVLLCPGNHDVDQSVIRENQLIQDGHDAVRRAATHYDRDMALTSRLTQPAARALFYSPIAAYNEFAARYQSSFFADNDSFVWQQDFKLNDGSTLRVRGLNTALLSGLSDYEGGLFLGTRAWTLPMQDGVEYLVMSHHPPRWLLDHHEAERALEGRARIHLFGHEHDQRVLPGRDWVKLFAGSINPHRAEPNWRPGYNIIEAHVEAETERRLKVNVHAREWQGNPPQFRALEDIDNNQVFKVDIRIGKYVPKDAPKNVIYEKQIDKPHSVVDSSSGGEVEKSTMDPQHRFRLIVFKFFKLSLSKKNELVGHLRLADDEDSKLPDVERFKMCLVRARERGQLDELEMFMEKLEKEQ